MTEGRVEGGTPNDRVSFCREHQLAKIASPGQHPVLYGYIAYYWITVTLPVVEGSGDSRMSFERRGAILSARPVARVRKGHVARLVWDPAIPEDSLSLSLSPHSPIRNGNGDTS